MNGHSSLVSNESSLSEVWLTHRTGAGATQVAPVPFCIRSGENSRLQGDDGSTSASLVNAEWLTTRWAAKSDGPSLETKWKLS